MRVPACPIPIQNTKLVMSHAHATGCFCPQTPTPVEIKYAKQNTMIPVRITAGMNRIHQSFGCRFSTMPQMRFVIQL
jgi:hypothetical protein